MRVRISWFLLVLLCLLLSVCSGCDWFGTKPQPLEAYSVSGRVTKADDPGVGIEGVTLSFGSGYGSATTGADGTWGKADLKGSVLIIPVKQGWNFSPSGRYVYVGSRDVDFTGRPVNVGEHGVVQAAAGDNHTLALKTDGTVWAWGSNTYGQLGNGTETDSPVPVKVAGLNMITAIVAGEHHSLALRADGTVWAWGDNSYGQLGYPGGSSSTPVQAEVSEIRSIAAGGIHSLALSYAGTVKSWGANHCGQLGNGNPSPWGSAQPIDVPYLDGVTAIAAGANHSLALRSDGTVRAWGDNSYGQLGDGTRNDSSTPGFVRLSEAGAGNIAAVAAGSDHNLAIDGYGKVWAWGRNDSGQLGYEGNDGLSPIEVDAFDSIYLFMGSAVAVDCGGNHSFARKADGTAWAWGADYRGQLGTGGFGHRQVPGLHGITVIGGGAQHSVAVKDDFSMWAWGDNSYGQLGSGTPSVSSYPIQVPAF